MLVDINTVCRSFYTTDICSFLRCFTSRRTKKSFFDSVLSLYRSNRSSRIFRIYRRCRSNSRYTRRIHNRIYFHCTDILVYGKISCKKHIHHGSVNDRRSDCHVSFRNIVVRFDLYRQNRRYHVISGTQMVCCPVYYPRPYKAFSCTCNHETSKKNNLIIKNRTGFFASRAVIFISNQYQVTLLRNSVLLHCNRLHIYCNDLYI